MSKLITGILLLTSVATAGTMNIVPTKEQTIVTGVKYTGGGSIEYKVKVFEDKERNTTCYVAYGEITKTIKLDGSNGAGILSISNPNISCIKNN
jgi:hypothetical protein